MGHTPVGLARHLYDQAAAEAAGSIFGAFVSMVMDGSVSETPVTLSPLPVGISFRPLPALDCPPAAPEPSTG